MRIHAFHRLYQHRVSLSTKPFNARGCKVKRCPYCQIKQDACLCDIQPDIDSNVAALLLLSENEVMKPSNTGRLIADTIKDTHVFQWNRTEPDEEILALLSGQYYQPIVVFPDEYVDDKSRLVEQLPENDESAKPFLFIFIDGSWREARKIFRRSDYLQNLPVLSINPERVSEYVMRKSDNEQHLSTAEVASLVLQEACEPHAAKTLQLWFEAFRESYMLSKTRYKSDLTMPCKKRYMSYIQQEISVES